MCFRLTYTELVVTKDESMYLTIEFTYQMKIVLYLEVNKAEGCMDLPTKINFSCLNL